MKRNMLRKTIGLSLGLGLCLGMVACDDHGSGKSKNGATASSSGTEVPAKKEEPPIEGILERRWSADISEAKQQIFDAVHPIGTAKSTRLHELKVTWKNGVRTNRPEDIVLIEVRYTVFWQGPVTKDGFTKMSMVYDPEIERFTDTKIIATNGITNDRFAKGVGIAVGFAVGAAMSGDE